MTQCHGSSVLFFCLKRGRGINCASGPCKRKPAWLPLHIHVSQCRFIASWHNVKDYQRELCGLALALSRFIDLLLFQIENVHSSSKQGILSLWVPSMERWGSVLSQANCCGEALWEGSLPSTCKRRGESRRFKSGFHFDFLTLFLAFQAVKLMDYLHSRDVVLYLSPWNEPLHSCCCVLLSTSDRLWSSDLTIACCIFSTSVIETRVMQLQIEITCYYEILWFFLFEQMN